MIALFLLAAATNAGTFTILGEGTMSCGEWVDSRSAEPDRALPVGAWVLGFVTAVSQMRADERPGKNITHGMDAHGIEHWMDNYCAAHPLDHVSSAAVALSNELIKRAQ